MAAQVEDVYEAKKKQWRMKGPGIVAKFIVSDPRRARAFGIKIVESSSTTTTSALLPFEAQLQIWRPILLAKFEQNRDAYDVLMSTVPYHLVEQARFPRKSNFWNAHLCQKTEEEVVITGENMFGRLLEHVRDELYTKSFLLHHTHANLPPVCGESTAP